MLCKDGTIPKKDWNVVIVGEDKLQGEALEEYNRLDDECDKVRDALYKEVLNGNMTMREVQRESIRINHARNTRMSELLKGACDD